MTSTTTSSAPRTALVTGAGVRVGRAIAEELLAAGYAVLLHHHSSTAGVDEIAAAARARGQRATPLRCDLTDPAALDALADEVLRHAPVLDVVVHNAGLFDKVPFAQVTRAELARMMAVHVEAPFFLTQRLLPALLRAPDPSIVHVTDAAAERPFSGYSAYAASKGALSVLTRALAVELGPKVRVNAVAPGAVELPADWTAAQREAVLRRVPLARTGSAHDVALAVRFLVQSPYLSGVSLPVDGGRAAVF